MHNANIATLDAALSLVSTVIMPPPRRERGNKRCVCLSVAYIANNSRTQRPSQPKFEERFPP